MRIVLIVLFIVSILIAIYFWKLIPDAITAWSQMISHPNVIVRAALRQQGVSGWVIFVRLFLAIVFTALSVWLGIKIF